MKTKEITRTVIAAVIAIIIAASSAAIINTVKVDAASYEGTAQGNRSQKVEVINQLPEKTTKLNQFAKAYYFKATGKTAKGYDWTYKTDTDNVKVKCKYDFTAHKYTFKLVGTAYGLNHFTLKYNVSDKKWASEKMTVFVDSQKNIMRTA